MTKKFILTKILALLFFLIFSFSLYSQDKIITNTNDTINCKIVTISGERIFYEQANKDNVIVGKSISASEVSSYLRNVDNNIAINNKPTNQYYNYVRKKKYSEKKYSEKKYNPKYKNLFSWEIGGMYSFIDIAASQATIVNAKEYDKYKKHITNGYAASFSYHRLIKTFFGLGFEYYFSFSGSKNRFIFQTNTFPMPSNIYYTVTQNERIYTHFGGLSFLFQQKIGAKEKLKITETFTPGFVFFRDETRGIDLGNHYYYNSPIDSEQLYYDYDNSRLKSTTWGIDLGLSLEYPITEKFYIGLSGKFLWSKIKSIYFQQGNITNNGNLQSSANVSQLHYGIILKYNFN
ncbi:MAG: hypothetical protein LBV69_00630 [Bacteroidales bacterium]|jgi:hypothetical protein|nr:hypothetical protein [Bacteroidales bacterium]